MRPQMAPPTSFALACYKGFSEYHLTSAISSEAERGYPNILGNKMRFSNFLHLKLLHLCSRSNNSHTRTLLEDLSSYNTASSAERSKFLNKVSVLMGYASIEHLVEQERVQRTSVSCGNSMLEEFDFTLARGRFPCIKLGDSSFVELYDEVPHQQERSSLLLPDGLNKYLPSSVDENWSKNIKPGEAWQVVGPPLIPFPGINSPLPIEEGSCFVVCDSQEADSAGEAKSNGKISGKKSATNLATKSVETKMPDEQILDKIIRCIPGTTSRQCRQLEDRGFHTVRKLLHHFPRTYADLQNAQGAIVDGQYLIFVGTVLSSRGIRANSTFAFHEVVVRSQFSNEKPVSGTMGDAYDIRDDRVYLHLKKYFRGIRFTSQPFLTRLQSKYQQGSHVVVSGKVNKMRQENHYEMKEYTIDNLEKDQPHAYAERRPYPLYPSKSGMDPSFLRDIISRAVKLLSTNIDPVPNEILQEFNLLSLCDAYLGIHCPKSLDEADLARRRLIFDDFFYLQLARLFQMLEPLRTQTEKEQLLDRYKNRSPNAVSVEEWSSLTKKLLEALPFSLTHSQLTAVSEIIWDLNRPVPMNRLLQGDVGCGKTIVALLACMEVIGSGFQAAFMVPTELLAVQHYEHVLSLLENVKENECTPSIALLTGSTPSKQSRTILNGIRTGDIAMVIGTTSLIADKVEFLALRIAVVDEQHRFGVIQRGTFSSKLYSSSSSLKMQGTSLQQSQKAHMAPHILAMSATPIPRTLALALYGDMSLTQITDIPPGRTPVATFVLEGNDKGFESVFQMMRDELTGGGKVYLVYPIIKESELLPQLRAATVDYQLVSDKFVGYQCGILHGRMTNEEKNDALRRFRSGETRILVSTQMIEVGLDVPDASMMVVMNAERFGFAQLHQLRGRVGRGERKSKCIFLSSTSVTLERLKFLEESSDGFYLANVDLLLRGPGNLLGKKQSGHLPEFPIARLVEKDQKIPQEAHLAAVKVLSTSTDLESFPKLKAELSMRQPLCVLGD